MVSAHLLSSILFSGLALASTLERRQVGACSSDDACRKVCKQPRIIAEGVVFSPSETVQNEARRRFGDGHCQKGYCSCDITSDDAAQDFCKYWVETSKEEFNGARYLDGRVDADNKEGNSILCVFLQ